MAQPIRTCIGCRRRAPCDELIRVVEAAGNLVVSRTAPGRGAWLCSGSPQCVARASGHNAFSRALRKAVPVAAVKDLRSELAEGFRREAGGSSSHG